MHGFVILVRRRGVVQCQLQQLQRIRQRAMELRAHALHDRILVSAGDV
jgi:hypothetical protein